MKPIIFTITCFFLFILPLHSQEKETYHRARISYSNQAQLFQLYSLGIDVVCGLHKKNVFLEADFSNHELQLAEENGFSTRIVIDDVEQYYANQNKGVLKASNKSAQFCSASNYATPTHFQLGSMGGFFTYDEILDQLDSMSILYPNLIKSKAPIDTFTTEENRNIFWAKISDNPVVDEDEGEILYTAVHHAREPASVATMLYFMWYLLENYASDPEIQSLVNNTELYFIPVVNPDGYVYNETNNPNGGGLWRKNRRNNGNGSYGVDNNRNYSYEWGTSGISFNPSSNVYCGTAPFSEVENQAVKWFCENHSFKIAFNNHSYGNLLLYPFAYAVNTPTPDHLIFEAISEEMVCENKYINQLSAELYPSSGDADDWMYVATDDKPKIFAFTPEIGSSSQGFWPAASEIIELCNTTMYMNLTAAHQVTKHAIIQEESATFYSDLSFDIPFELKRLGLEEAIFTVSIDPISTNITAVGNAVDFTDLDLLETESNSISLELASSIENGDLVEYNLVVDNGEYSSSTFISKVYGQSQIVFEQVDDLSNWQPNEWGVSTTEFLSNPTSITDSPLGEYDNNSVTTIESQDIDLNNALAAELSFDAKWEIEEEWDYVQLSISIDDGVSWVPQCGSYTRPGTNYQAPDQPIYDGFQLDWVQEKISLNNYLGETIKIRFQLVADQGVTEDGFYFDNLAVTIIPESCNTDIPVPCDDQNPNTINDIIQSDCSCMGSYFITLDLKTFLEGPYDPALELMNDNLRNLSSFPLIEPFTNLNENLMIGGGETTTAAVLAVEGNDAIVDWVLVELRDGENPSTIIQTQAALLQRDGDIVSAEDGVSNLVFQDHNTNYNSVVVALKHRNHFGVRNSIPINLSTPSLTINLDFSDPTIPILGGTLGMTTVNNKRLMISGDANRDGQINPVDKNDYWRVENGYSYDYINSKADFNLDGAVNPVDKNGIWQINNSKIEQLD